MAKQLQFRRGTTLQNSAFVGAVGEPTLDTETGMIHIHDGVTQGGKEFIDPVVAFQRPTADNNYTWYRKYASGWVEQGGLRVGVSGVLTITFPVEMADNKYTIIKTMSTNSTSQPAEYRQFSFYSLTTTGATTGTAGADFSWQVSGMAA